VGDSASNHTNAKEKLILSSMLVLGAMRDAVDREGSEDDIDSYYLLGASSALSILTKVLTEEIDLLDIPSLKGKGFHDLHKHIFGSSQIHQKELFEGREEYLGFFKSDDVYGDN
jgi:hypothetical protein